MDKPLISVIVPIYKVEDYLDRCIESIVNQTYHNLEIILVDDGSPDNCPLMCDKWAKKDKRIKVIHKENGGLSDARNAGMEIATGEYISFVDSDDLVDVVFLEELHRVADKTGAELVACDLQLFRSENELARSPKIVGYKEYSSEQALSQLIKGKGFRAVAWNKLYKADLLLAERFEYGKLHEDEFFTYRIISKCSRLVFVDAPLYYYRQRQDSIMGAKSLRHLDGLEAGLQRLSFLKENYPNLYYSDRVTYCIGCINGYVIADSGRFEKANQAKKKIKAYRKCVEISVSEWLKYDMKSKIYILMSSPMLIGIFAKIKKEQLHYESHTETEE